MGLDAGGRDPIDLERGEDRVPAAVALHVQKRVRHRDGHFVPHLGRPYGVGEDHQVTHGFDPISRPNVD
jgi:hypothetical protein